MGIAYQKLKELGLAIAALKEAVRLEPDDAVFHHDLAVGLALDGQIAGAITHYQKASGLDRKKGEADLHLGNLLLAQRKPDEAIPYLREAITRYKKALELAP